MNYNDYIRDIPDWPTEGVMFKDITPLLADNKAFKTAIEEMAAPYKDAGITKVMGAEARGFLFGTAIAYVLDAGFVPARKPGKLPAKTISADYELEYGTATIEMHKDAITPGQKVIIVDDLIATGGTTEAIIKLVEELGGEVVKVLFLMELEGLKGRDKIAGYDVESVIKYPGK